MLPGLYSAATALTAAEKNHETIARNLAHVDVSGYRRQIAIFEPFAAHGADTAAADNVPPGGVGTQVGSVRTDFTQGPLQATGRNLDLAITGDGYFVIEGPDGPLYTRNGTFHVDSEGRLVTADGRAVIGDGGSISFPAQTAPAQITFGRDGSIRADGADVGSLRLVSFADNQQLVPVGTTLFQAPPDLQPDPATGSVQQGAREASNVSAVDELVRMIVGMRHYEAAQQTLRALADALEQTTNTAAG